MQTIFVLHVLTQLNVPNVIKLIQQYVSHVKLVHIKTQIVCAMIVLVTVMIVQLVLLLMQIKRLSVLFVLLDMLFRQILHVVFVCWLIAKNV